ncbi:MAG: SGNH/GDSL hydrolase family protein [Myxococcales bacterium]|nr:SGNH/GDSL hydrolase family protein [Myxococcales bacterium]
MYIEHDTPRRDRLGSDSALRSPRVVASLGVLALALACGDAAGTETLASSESDAVSTSPTEPSATSVAGSTATTTVTTAGPGGTDETSAGSTATSSSSDPSDASDTTAATAGDTTTGGATTSDATTEATSAGATTDGPPVGLDALGSLVVLGDSISDGGGQPPYYYDLLRDSLTTHYGPIAYHNAAKSGSQTNALKGQAESLPDSLPGPVAVVITSGGNDMKANILQVALGLDGPVKMAVASNIDAALGELLAPGRFGPGVEVHVFEGNIYDASDGQGDYGANGCSFGEGLPMLPVDMYFDAWNAVIADAVDAREQAPVDMHGYFYGHGYHADPNWYAPDCTHPNAIGHAALRDLFFEHITGEPAP